MEPRKLPPVQLIDLGNMTLWHRTSEVEQLMYEMFQLGILKEKESDKNNA